MFNKLLQAITELHEENCQFQGCGTNNFGDFDSMCYNKVLLRISEAKSAAFKRNEGVKKASFLFHCCVEHVFAYHAHILTSYVLLLKYLFASCCYNKMRLSGLPIILFCDLLSRPVYISDGKWVWVGHLLLFTFSQSVKLNYNLG